MASALTAILKAELAAQRLFLSSDEEQALSYPASYEDETDLAWDRVRQRRSIYFFPMLRTYYIRERRPVDRWKALIDAEEAGVGEATFISQMAREVLVWEALTSDRAAMALGFAGRALKWVGILFLLLGVYAYFNGGQVPGAIVGVAGVLFFLAGRACARSAARRAAALRAATNSGFAGPAVAGT